nr:4Fe-4S dicluster domain-containing protein [Marinifilum caeruleilacunae]
MACNHCEDAPCMKNCPALSYTRDEKTGAIIHHAEACIGCTYCTWACPYDAPKFNPTTKIVEKCNFCVDRISDGKRPACVEACPVGALDFGQLALKEEDRVTPGFVDMGIKPSIQLIPLREEHSTPKIENTDKVEIDPKKIKEWLPKAKDKVALDKEWTLVLFTIAVAGLFAWQAAHLLSFLPMQLLPFSILSVLAIALTSLHIGKKMRMWRFILNLKGSWLSREIFSFSGFLGLTGLQLITGNIWFGIAASIFGILALISVDMVYKLLQRKDNLLLHSGMVVLTGIFFFAWIGGISIILETMILLKAILYAWRKISLRAKNITYFPMLSLLRILCLFIPYLLFDLEWEQSLAILLPIVFVGEIIDRAEFYHESDVITPEKQLRMTS